MILPQLFYALGWMLVILAISHVPGLIAGLVFQEAVGTTAMVLSTALSAFAGIGLLLSFRGTNFVNDRRLTLLTPSRGFQFWLFWCHSVCRKWCDGRCCRCLF